MDDRCAMGVDGSRTDRVDDEVLADLPTNDRGTWRCPRRASEGGDYCILHDPAATDEEIRREVVRSLRGEIEPDRFAYAEGRRVERAATRFLGIEVERLDLSDRRFFPDGTGPIDLRCSAIGELDVSDARFGAGLRLDGGTVGSVLAAGATIEGTLSCRGTHVEGSLDLDDVVCEGDVDCRFAEVDGDVSLARAVADGRFDFGFTDVEGEIDAEKGACRGRFTLKEATVGGVVAADLVVTGTDRYSSIPGLQFRGVTVEGDLDVRRSEVSGTLIGHDLTVGGDILAAESTIEDDVILGNEDSSTDLPNPTVWGTVDFSAATVGREFRIAGRTSTGLDPTVGGALDLSEATLGRAKIAPAFENERVAVVDLREATVEDGFLGQPSASTTCYDLKRTTLGTVTLERGEKSTVDRCWFDRTTFDGFRFDTNRHDFSRLNWSIHGGPEAIRTTVATGRAYPRATALAKDASAIVSERPAFRRRLREDPPPFCPHECAEAVFEGLSDEEIERIATNGPETEGVLGPSIFTRERYRAGLVTLLAREYVRRESNGLDEESNGLDEESNGLDEESNGSDDSEASDTVVGSLFENGGEELSRLAAAVDSDSADSVAEAVDAVTVAFARALADEEAVALDLDDVQTTYVKARKGASDVGDSVAAAQFFIKELRFRRADHRRAVFEGPGLRRRLRGANDYLWNRSFDLLAGYGERPRRVVLASISVIGVFTVAFYFLGLQLEGITSGTYGGLSGALLLSLESFTSLVLGGTSVEPPVMRFVANVQGFVGAFLIALLVFTLTRSLHR